MLAASFLALLLGLAGPAGAAKSPAPLPLVEISLPNLIKQPSTVPSHPVKVEVPGLTKVEVGLPDVGALLGGNKAASAAPEPAESSAPSKPSKPSKPTASAAPATPRPSGGSVSTRSAAPSASSGSSLSGPVRSSDSVRRTAVPVAAEVPVRRGSDASAPKAKSPAAAKAKAAADVFRGMLKGSLPVWLLVGIVVACAAGTIVVVRSGRRQDAS